jgi:HSP20 family protein
MASNISVRRENDVQKQMQQVRGADWEPWRVMRSLLSWDPFRELGSSLLTPYQYGKAGETELGAAFDVKETPEAFVFYADVPGLKEKDLDIQVSGNRLTIRGKRETELKEEIGHTYYACERSFGSFARSFTLPDSADIEKCSADLKDGVLTLTVAKKASERPRNIAIKPQSQKS